MKKIFGFLFVFAFFCSLSSANAVETGTISVESRLLADTTELKVNGYQYSEGNIDYHILPWTYGNVAYAADDPARKIVIKPSDPFLIRIDGVQYILVQYNNDGLWDENDILGYTDKPDNLFHSLVNLASNPLSGQLTPQDLKEQNVRMVAVGKNGKLKIKNKAKDFDLNKIYYIDIKNLKKLANSSSDGIFGHFNVYLKDGRMIIGYVTFSESSLLKNLF